MTTQDFLKTIDLSAATVPITGTQMNQLLETATPASDKGFVISSTDVAGVPEVPDPDHTYGSVMPTWWKRYIWRRQMVDEVRTYVWDETAAVDPTLLQWVQLDVQGATAATDAAAALAAANQAQIDATAAVATANSAESQAQLAQADADELDTAVTAMGNRVTAIENDLARYQTGDLRCSAGAITYSTTEDQGWLPCDGSSVSITTFAALYAVIGNTFGGSGGVMSLPDLRGRTVVGVGTGSGLTARAVGATGGAERVTLSATESGIAAHKHQITVEDSVDAPTTSAAKSLTSEGGGGNTTWANVANDEVAETRDVAGAAASNSHENMPPFIALHYYIKT